MSKQMGNKRKSNSAAAGRASVQAREKTVVKGKGIVQSSEASADKKAAQNAHAQWREVSGEWHDVHGDWGNCAGEWHNCTGVWHECTGEWHGSVGEWQQCTGEWHDSERATHAADE